MGAGRGRSSPAGSNHPAPPEIPSRYRVTPLISELEAAKRRGVEVEIILETSHTEIVNRGNRASAERLLEGGIEAMFFPTFPVMHTKLVLIDDEVSIVGSHNWTNAAMYVTASPRPWSAAPRPPGGFGNTSPRPEPAPPPTGRSSKGKSGKPGNEPVSRIQG